MNTIQRLFGKSAEVFPKESVRDGKINRLKEQNKALMESAQQMSDTAILNIEEWIVIVKSRTQALELLRKYASDNQEVINFLVEQEER